MLANPIFILASPFSFRAALCAMLGQHPNLYDLPDMNLLAREYPTNLLDEPATLPLDGLLRSVGQLYGGEQTLESMEMARRWLYQRLSKQTRDIYLELCRKIDPLRMVDSSAAYTNPKQPETLHRIGAGFPKAYYIHLVRHPRTQCQAWMKDPRSVSELHALKSYAHDTNQPVIDPQFDWQHRNRMILNFLDGIPTDRWIRLRGEDVISNPRDHLEEICRWLKIPWNESVYEAMLATENSVYSSAGPYGAKWGRNPEFLRSPALRQRYGHRTSKLDGALPWRTDGAGLTGETIELARQFGYE
ncbi:MAG: sulfotransferase [Gammaproteobacteria bacterium]|nr:sulfotransferase [Gammaproteobacteria bacterium]